MQPRTNLPSFLSGLLCGLGAVVVLGLARPDDAEGPYEVEISDDGNTIVLVDSKTGRTWVRHESGRALSSSAFRLAGSPESE